MKIRSGLAVLLAIAAWGWLGGVNLDSGLEKLVPGFVDPTPFEKAGEVFEKRMANQIFLVLHHPDDKLRRQGAKRVEDWIGGESRLAITLGQRDPMDWKTFSDLLFSMRFALGMKGGPPWTPEGGKAFFKERLGDVFSGFSPLLEFKRDPLLLFQEHIESRVEGSPALRPSKGWMEMEHEGKVYILLMARLNGSALDGDKGLVARIEHLTSELAETGARLEKTGALFFAQDQSSRIKAEVGIIGVVSVLGVILLFWWVFRAWGPLLFSLTCVTSGVVVGMGCTLASFGGIHLIALGFGSTLIGISVDYAFHLLCHRSSREESGEASQLHRAMFWSFGTTSLALLTFFLAPLPVMQQMSVFIVTGLLAALLTCLALSEKLKVSERHRGVFALHELRAKRLLALGGFHWLPLLVLLFLLGGGIFWTVEFNDDLRSFGNPTQEMLKKNRWVQTLMGKDGDWKRLIIQGNNKEEALVREEKLRIWLEENHGGEKIKAVTRSVPSKAYQMKQVGYWLEALGKSQIDLEVYLETLGMTEMGEGILAEVKSYEARGVEEILGAQPGSEVLAQQILQGPDGVFTCLFYQGEKVVPPWPWAKGYDRVGDVNKQLRVYRVVMGQWFGLAALATVLLQLIFLGWGRGFRVALPPVLAMVGTWSLILLVDPLGLNLFHLLATVLVWGVGMDYAIMVNRSERLRPSTLVANACSACTSLLSFGLLCWSGSPVLSSLGLTVCMGILLALIFSGLLQPPKKLPS